MIGKMKKFIFAALLISAPACSELNAPMGDRWYTKALVSQGANLFKKHCAICHGDSAQGTAPNWRQALADGSYPPPPLNGSAHAWHHPIKVLKRTIRRGGIPVGGKMPPFEGRLSNAEIESVIAFFQNMWGDEIYSAWKERGGLK